MKTTKQKTDNAFKLAAALVVFSALVIYLPVLAVKFPYEYLTAFRVFEVLAVLAIFRAGFFAFSFCQKSK